MKPLARSPKFAICLVLAALANAVKGNELAADLWLRPHEVLGTQSCSSVSCHGQLQPQNSATSIHGQAYHLWLAHDPHARAGLRMLRPRFQEVLRRASQRADGGVDAAVEQQCAKCHDPNREGEAPAEPSISSHIAISPNPSPSRSIAQGIGCESCHGPASHWIAKHYELNVSRNELSELGMIDTKNVLVRARLCASCHVGSAENNVTHDMLAAGHPPLRFELASHQALIDRKHWDDGPRRRAEPEYEVQLWAAGRIASAEAALALLEARANRAATDETRMNTDGGRGVWPELAEYSCFACHQSLRPAAGAATLSVAASRASGVPPWQQWNFECVPVKSPAFAAALDQLRNAMEQSYDPSPGKVAQLAATARASLASTPCLPLDSSAMIELLADRGGEFSWERACHELAALTAVASSRGEPTLRPDRPDLPSRASIIAGGLRFVRSDSEWPAAWSQLRPADPKAAGTISLEQIRHELDALRSELAKP